MAFSIALLRDDHEVVAVKYFTSRVLPYPPDESAVTRQNVYLQAVSRQPKIQITEGIYNRRKTLLPFAAQPCKSCERVPSHMARVFKFEGKRTDVALVSAMIADAANSRAESLVLISGDSDFVPAIETVRREFGRQVLVFDPSEVHSEHLKIVSSYYRNIPRDLPARCQLPDAIPVGTHGNFIHRPAAWMSGRTVECSKFKVQSSKTRKTPLFTFTSHLHLSIRSEVKGQRSDSGVSSL